MIKVIFGLILCCLIPINILALDDCPLNKTDSSCEYPGECGSYIDIDNNNACDHSQLALENQNIEPEEDTHDLITGKDLKTKTVGEIAKIYKIDSTEYEKRLNEFYKTTINTQDSFQLLHDNYGIEPDIAKNIATSIKNKQTTNTIKQKDLKQKKTYHLFAISITLSLLYLTTSFLSKRKTITPLTHKRIWNIFLLATFSISGILGILLVIKINFGLTIPLFFNILLWHVEIGIAMCAISIFHIIERWYFFKNIITN
jgi:hypothetical protein